jgi:hypothetical protein
LLGAALGQIVQAAQLDGASRWQIFRYVIVPLSRFALLSGIMMCWARALGEFGATMMFAGNFPPRGYALCDGQLLSIAQNTALFSILGTTYGGNGQTTFALPDLRGRAPIHSGAGPGLTPRSLGEIGGTENRTITTHTHTVPQP